MAVVIKCDFCGDEYKDAKQLGTIEVRLPAHTKGRAFDICPVCIQAVDAELKVNCKGGEGEIIPDGVKV